MNEKTLRERALNMAQTIWKTLFWSLEVPEVLSWGISKRKATIYQEMLALELSVNGMIHKGIVTVCYNEGADVFVVFLMDKKRNVLKKMDNVFADELGRRIDEEIERPQNVSDDVYRSKIFSELLKAI